MVCAKDATFTHFSVPVVQKRKSPVGRLRQGPCEPSYSQGAVFVNWATEPPALDQSSCLHEPRFRVFSL